MTTPTDQIRVLEQRLGELEYTYAERLRYLERESERGKRIRGALTLLVAAIALLSFDASYDSSGNFKVQTRPISSPLLEVLASALAVGAGAVITGKPDAFVHRFLGHSQRETNSEP